MCLTQLQKGIKCDAPAITRICTIGDVCHSCVRILRIKIRIRASKVHLLSAAAFSFFGFWPFAQSWRGSGEMNRGAGGQCPVGLSPFVNLQKRTKAYNCETPFVDLQNLQKPTKTYNYEHKNVTKVHKNVTKVTITSRSPAALRYSIFFLLYFFLLYRIFFYCTVFFSTVLYFFLLYCIFFYKSYNCEQESYKIIYKSYNCEQESYNCEPFALQLRAKNLQKNLQLRATKSTKGDRPSSEGPDS